MYSSNDIGKLNKISPLEFKQKKDFFFKYADLIFDSHPSKKDNSYLDVLEKYKTFDNILDSSNGNESLNRKQSYVSSYPFKMCRNSIKDLFKSNSGKVHMMQKKVNGTIVDETNKSSRIKQFHKSTRNKPTQFELAMTRCNTQKNFDVPNSRTHTPFLRANPSKLSFLNNETDLTYSQNNQSLTPTQSLIDQLKSTQLRFILNHKNMMTKHNKGKKKIIFFKNVVKDYFRNHKHKNFFNEKEQKIFEEKLNSLDELKKSIPKCRHTIDTIKNVTVDIEKRKIILSNEIFELNSRLDELPKKNPEESQKNKIKPSFAKYKSLCPHKNNIQQNRLPYSTTEENVKAKFKNFGKSKILVLPKEFKRREHIYEDKTIITIAEIKKSLQDILDKRHINVKSGIFLKAISTPKGSVKKITSPLSQLKSSCSDLEIGHDKIKNSITRMKKDLDQCSLYVDPKAAFTID